MRYGLSLLVCFAMSVCANAQTVCNGTTCQRPITTAVKTVVSAPVAVARGVVGSCCRSQSSQVSQAPAKQIGPIRQFFRNVFRR